MGFVVLSHLNSFVKKRLQRDISRGRKTEANKTSEMFPSSGEYVLKGAFPIWVQPWGCRSGGEMAKDESSVAWGGQMRTRGFRRDGGPCTTWISWSPFLWKSSHFLPPCSGLCSASSSGAAVLSVLWWLRVSGCQSHPGLSHRPSSPSLWGHSWVFSSHLMALSAWGIWIKFKLFVMTSNIQPGWAPTILTPLSP